MMEDELRKLIRETLEKIGAHPNGSAFMTIWSAVAKRLKNQSDNHDSAIRAWVRRDEANALVVKGLRRMNAELEALRLRDDDLANFLDQTDWQNDSVIAKLKDFVAFVKKRQYLPAGYENRPLIVPQMGLLYRHFKGGYYKPVQLVANATNAQGHARPFVIYVSVSGADFYCRDLGEWNEPVEWPDGVVRDRFMRAAVVDGGE